MRRPLLILLALAIVFGGASFALWHWTVGRMAVAFAAWSDTAAAQGWTVHSGAMRPAGWPRAAELTLADLSLTAGPDVLPGGASWVAQRAVLHISPLSPAVLEVRLEGVQRVRAFGSATVPFVADRLALTVPIRDPAPVRLDASQLRFDAPLAGMTIGLLAGEAQAFPAAGQGQPALSFTLSAEAVALPPPPALQPALGRRIASATIQGALDGTLPPPSPDFAQRAAAWQRSGGMVLVQHMAVGWGPLGVTGTAAVGLDGALQPAGTATLRVVGYDAALRAMAAGGTLAPSAAQAMRGVLTLLARTPAGGGVPEVELPLTLRAGMLAVGTIPVGKIPAVVWPTAP